MPNMWVWTSSLTLGVQSLEFETVTKQVAMWSGPWLGKTTLAHLKWGKTSYDQGHVHSTEVLQLHPYNI